MTKKEYEENLAELNKQIEANEWDAMVLREELRIVVEVLIDYEKKKTALMMEGYQE
jgi:hypothetical protein